MSFWRTASGSEVDLILGDADAAIEIKSSEDVEGRTKGLHLFLEERKCKKAFIVSREPRPRKLTSKITVLPWKVFCEMLWAGEII
jgi:predicted AAA+ superfamily ATPase